MRPGPVPSTHSVLAGLDPQQRAAAQAATGPVCILAGAGTGKTRTITHRIAYQVAAGLARPEQVLAVTFTDKAAGELRRRLQSLGLPRPVRATTFHAAALAQLRFFWPQVHKGPPPQVLASKLALLAPTARRLGVEATDLAAEIEWAKARRVSADGYAQAADGRRGPLGPEQLAAVYARYEADKAARSLLDYEDMILAATELLEQRSDVAEQVRDRYRFFTVDEFQDVNPAQYALLRAWLGSSDELCVVGDDDQSIYGFTGASPEYLTGFGRAFPRARLLRLTRSYRSTPQVLAMANRVLWTKPARGRRPLTTGLP
ncbi:MAG: ATP-dependent helicase, partial [Actinomycetota bacterium]|nr:ATP-dependent helicase [Actinomycetota bacterium]